MPKPVLIVGSGMSANRIAGADLSDFTVVCLNNAWRLLPRRWEYLVFPTDFYDWPDKIFDGQRFVLYTEYQRAFVQYGGASSPQCIQFNALYWVLDVLRPPSVGFIGCDLYYPKDEQTHFYGQGTADPLRHGEEVIRAQLARTQEMADTLGIKLVNYSDGPTLLPYERGSLRYVEDTGYASNIAYFPPKMAGYANYATHCVFVQDLFRAAGTEVRYSTDCWYDKRTFLVRYADTAMVFDFSDHVDVNLTYAGKLPYFKFHYQHAVHWSYAHMHPFVPISFYDWQAYEKLQDSVLYTGESEIILAKQRDCVELQNQSNTAMRRRSALTNLRRAFRTLVDSQLVSQEDYWRAVGKCLVSVHVPGARHDILDRGQLQYMGLGCCTISPYLTTQIVGKVSFEPDVHYVECAPDFSDLVEKVKWVADNRDVARTIGATAKVHFRRYCLPNTVIGYVRAVIGAKKGKS